MTDDQPHADPLRETWYCAICAAAHASFGFGPPGVLPADAWYCSEHREDGERAWAARLRGCDLRARAAVVWFSSLT